VLLEVVYQEVFSCIGKLLRVTQDPADINGYHAVLFGSRERDFSGYSTKHDVHTNQLHV
jgi:hypothetical protein